MLVKFLWGLLVAISFSDQTALANITPKTDGFELSEEDNSVELSPVIQVSKKTWVRANQCIWRGSKGPTLPGIGVLSCQMEDYGELRVIFKRENILKLEFRARQSLELSGLGLSGRAHIKGARAFLSNGVQSWSQSSVLAISPAPSPETIESLSKDFSRREEMRSGEHISFDTSFIAGESHALLAGALAATTFRTWMQVSNKDKNSSELIFKIISGGLHDQVKLGPGESLENDDYTLLFTDKLDQSLENYAKKIKTRSKPKNANKRHTIGWNSWYEHFSKVNAEDIRSNAALVDYFLLKRYRASGLSYPRPIIYIDDGWQVDWGDWRSNDKFPQGIETAAKEINARDYDAGIWIAPLLARSNIEFVKDHPDWFFKNKFYQHPSGQYAILDVSHPEAAQHLYQTIRSLVDHGFNHLKVDFLIAGLVSGQRHEHEMTSLQAYRLALKIIREAAGQETHILACGAPTLSSFPYVDSWRIGPDIALEVPAKYLGPSWADTANQARNISARWFYCHATSCDADPLLLRGAHMERFESSAWITNLVAGGLFLSDNLNKLIFSKWNYATTAESLKQGLAESPAKPNPLVPEILVTRMDSPNFIGRILDRQFIRAPSHWQLADGRKLVINFNSKAMMEEGEKIYPRQSRLF